MKYYSDRDGKSKTASAVDEEHYPEQNEAETAGANENSYPSHDQIAERAFELWHARGCPIGSPEQDWLQAEAELLAEAAPRFVSRGDAATAGSVQR
ncbi:MAG TPA: DUF2934 domain-containing protein [Bryobacteraceae bacterium]|nr:DUF2934 domain-containing protein [Bryobacteraceae bacterium]